jgi:hypothetical protein
MPRPAQSGGHLGVGDRHHAVGKTIERKRVPAFDVELEAVVGGIVADG